MSKEQEQFEADYLAACPKHGAQTIAKYRVGKNVGAYVNQVTRTAFRIWLQQHKRHEAEKAELVTLLKRYVNETPIGHQPHMITHIAIEAIAKYEVES